MGCRSVKPNPDLSHGFVALIAGGWQVNSILSLYTGTPFTVTASATSLNAPGNSQVADQVKSQVAMPEGVGMGASWFDPTAFASVTAARFGNAGLNILRGPGVANLDLGLFRSFHLAERWNLQFRAEAFNATNTPHFNNPAANVSNTTLNSDGSIPPAASNLAFSYCVCCLRMRAGPSAGGRISGHLVLQPAYMIKVREQI